MENSTTFDLNLALQRWLARLGDSDRVRPADLQELESHVRDSMSRLESGGLSAEESFLVATHRVGQPEKLEPEFGKVNRNLGNLCAHGLIVLFFATACWLLWALLHLPGLLVVVRQELALPGFTRLLLAGRDWLVLPPALATAYTLWAGCRSGWRLGSWMSLFAVVAAFLFLLTLPILIAVMLPVINLMNHLPR